MDWNRAFPDTNFNFEDEDVRLEKTVKTLTKVSGVILCSSAKSGAKPALANSQNAFEHLTAL